MIPLTRIRALCEGFSGRFFYDAERGDLAYVAKNCDDRTCDCERKTNSEGDQDCSVCIGDMDHGADTGEPIAQMLNAVPELLAEVERLRALALEACELAKSFDVHGSQPGERDRLIAIRAATGGAK